MVGSVRARQPIDAFPDLRAPVCELFRRDQVLFVPGPSADDPAAVLDLCRDYRLGHRQRPCVVHGRAELCRSQVHVPVGGAVDDEPDSPAHLKRCYANAATHACIERLRRDLGATQHDKGVNRFKRNPLTALRRRHEQGSPTVLHARTVVPHVDSVQVAHRKTTLSMYRFTLRGALERSGRQWCRSWHSVHRASLGASGNSNVSSCVLI